MTRKPIPILLCITLIASACGGGGSSVIPPFDLYEGIAIADLNNDNLPDIAVTFRHIAASPPHPGYVSVYLQNPSSPGTFHAPVTYPVGNDPWTLKIADLNADNLPDIIVVNTESYSVSVLYQQNGSPGVFRQAIHFPTTIKPSGLAIHDINGDGWPDIAVSGYGGTGAPQNGAAILLHDLFLTESFSNPVVIDTGSAAESIAVGDINSDGTADLVVDSDTDIRILLQSPMSPMTFATPVPLVAGTRPSYVVLADFDVDGHVDILVANAGSNTDGSGASITFLRQNPAIAGQFLAPVPFTTASGARSFVVQDLDGDNYPDLAVATVVLQSQSSGVVSVLRQNSASPGTVLPRVDYSAGFTPYFIDAGDLNHDGNQDLALTDEPVILFQQPLQIGTFGAPVKLVP